MNTQVSFNPTVIRFKPERKIPPIEPTAMFQSHRDSIQTSKILLLDEVMLCFNPTVIRFKPE